MLCTLRANLLVSKQGMCSFCAGQLPSFAVHCKTQAKPWRSWIATALASDANSSGCTTGNSNDRAGRPSKKAKVESCVVRNMVHHVWLQLPGNELFHSGQSCPSSLTLESNHVQALEHESIQMTGLQCHSLSSRRFGRILPFWLSTWNSSSQLSAVAV